MDTNAILWHFYDRPRLSPAAVAVLDAATPQNRVFVSTITLVELIYLQDKPGFPYPNALARLIADAASPAGILELVPVRLDIAPAVERVPRAEIADMPDRIVAATAVAPGLPVVSSDSRIRGSAALRSLVPVIW